MSVAVGDESLNTIQTPGAVGLVESGLEHNGLKVATGIGFGEVHSHGFTGTNARQVAHSLVVIGKFIDGFSAVLKTPDVYKACIGAAYHVGSHDVRHQREVQAIIAAWQRYAHEASLYEGLEVFLCSLCVNHVTVNYVRTFVVNTFGIRSYDVAGYFTCYFKDLFV